MDAKFDSYLVLNLSRIKSKNYRKRHYALRHSLTSQTSSSPLFKEWKILKIKDIVDLQNSLLYHSFLNGKVPTSFETFFQRCSDIHNAPTRFRKSQSLYMPRFKSVKYDINFFTNACIQSWNKTTKILDSSSSLSLSEVKQEMSNH